jgi:hypothetical protein
MWHDGFEQRMTIVNQRQSELRAEAESNRAIRRRTVGTDRFSGLQIHLGSLLIVVGRTFADDKSSPKAVRF